MGCPPATGGSNVPVTVPAPGFMTGRTTAGAGEGKGVEEAGGGVLTVSGDARVVEPCRTAGIAGDGAAPGDAPTRKLECPPAHAETTVSRSKARADAVLDMREVDQRRHWSPIPLSRPAQ